MADGYRYLPEAAFDPPRDDGYEASSIIPFLKFRKSVMVDGPKAKLDFSSAKKLAQALAGAMTGELDTRTPEAVSAVNSAVMGAAVPGVASTAARGTAPGSVGMFYRAPDASKFTTDAKFVMGKGGTNSEAARELWADAGRLVDAQGNVLAEMSDAPLRLTDHAFSLLSHDQLRRGHTHVSGTADQVFSHSELFDKVPVTSAVSTDAVLHPLAKENTGAFAPQLGVLVEGNQLAAFPKLLAHEFQHVVQQAQGLPKGSNPDVFLELLNKDHRFRALPFEKKTALADELYRRVEGEQLAYATDARLRMTNAQRRETFPWDSVPGGAVQQSERLILPAMKALTDLPPDTQAEALRLARLLASRP